MIALRQLTGTVLMNRLRAMTPASTVTHATEFDAQLIGLSDSGDEDAARGLSCYIVDSQADTEVEEEDEVGPAGSPLSLSSSPSFVAETPLSVSRGGGLSGGSERVRMAALLRREETGERAASVCAGGGGAVGDHRDAVRSECSIGALAVMTGVEAAVVAGDGMGGAGGGGGGEWDVCGDG